MYSYRLKSEFQKKGLNPNTIYRVAKDGTQCAYLWDDCKIYDRGLLKRVDHIKIGWIPSSENFDWDQSVFVGYSATTNKLLHITDAHKDITENNVGSVLIKGSTYSTAEDKYTKDCALEDINKLKYLADLKKFNEKQPSSPYWTDPPTIQPTKKETMLENIIATNKAAATQAAYLEAGRLANVTMAEILFKKFPSLPQTPFNALVVANLADVIGKQINPSPKLQKVTQAMVTQAYAEVYQLIDLEGMIGELLNTVGDSFVESE